jgi:hypothetical protein
MKSNETPSDININPIAEADSSKITMFRHILSLLFFAFVCLVILDYSQAWNEVYQTKYTKANECRFNYDVNACSTTRLPELSGVCSKWFICSLDYSVPALKVLAMVVNRFFKTLFD